MGGSSDIYILVDIEAGPTRMNVHFVRQRQIMVSDIGKGTNIDRK